MFSDIAVIGTGYVGLVTGACFAELGNNVACLDIDESRIRKLREGTVPFFEPGLQELVGRNVAAARLRFEIDPALVIPDARVVFVAVGTPQGADGNADLSQVRDAASTIARHIGRDTIVVNKSTVPVETGDLVGALIRERNATGHRVTVVSNPEFLREGSAISDFMRPDRIVIGVDEPGGAALVRELYAPLEAKIVETTVRTAEMIKYAANAFLATKISFANEVAAICDRVGVDVVGVMRAVGGDARIGAAFLGAGLGYGGSCFPKDVSALAYLARGVGVETPLLDATMAVNAGADRARPVRPPESAYPRWPAPRLRSWASRSSRIPTTFANRPPSR